MKRNFILLVTIFLTGVLASSPAMSGVLDGPIINPANSHTYYLLTPNQTWTAAEAEAVALGGHLVTINDQAEQDWVWSTFGIPSQRWLWIGINDVNQEGIFEWVSGEPITFTYWTPGEPNDFPPGEDFGEMDAFKGGKWNDLQVDAWAFRHYGVVEIGSPSDSDNDGVLDGDDFCADTAIPEGVPTVRLRPNRWALINDDFYFDTIVKGKGKGPNRSYIIEDTAGCSCEQIIEAQGLGNGHTYHGCSIGAMDEWIEFVTP